MGIFDALNAAVSGLQAQSFALQNISGNIANSQTTGYKETDTSFEDLVSSASLNQQTSGGVFASSVETNGVQGTIQNESTATDMAINGDGFFSVAKPTGFSDNQPTFNDVSNYTRRGDFQVNSNGYLVNGSGYYLMGIPVAASTGNPIGSVPQVLQFNNNFVGAQATTSINYEANLPSGEAVLNPASFESNPVFGAQPAAEITGTGANLNADAPATGTGTVTTLTAATTIPIGQTFTVSDGTNTTTYTSSAGHDTVADLITAINGGSAAASVSLTGGSLVLTSTGANADTTALTVGGGTANAQLGFTSGTVYNPVNLMTQNAVADGETLVVSTDVSGQPPIDHTITFGPGGVQTMAQLQTALGGLGTDVSGSIDASGNISLTAAGANSAAETITVGGTATASKFGIQNTTAYPATGTVIANDFSTFTSQSINGGSVTCYDTKGNPVNVDFRWAKTASSASGDTWQLFYQTNTTATGSQPAWQNANQSSPSTPPET